jgi:Domain of unknown function (DUF4190)
MKKCPTCERTFEDSMRFCQSDGTPLVDDTPVDPYKTMVARPEDIAAAIPPSSDAPVAEAPKEGEVLELPVESDPLKTMYASEEEIRKEMNAHDATDEVVMDIPPLAPEPPKFSEPSLSPPSFTDPPPPSPFNPSGKDAPVESPFSKTTPPIPSPFTDPKPSTYEPPAPNFPQFKDPDPVVSTASASPFDPPSSATPEWTSPPAIEPSFQNQEPMQNPSFTPSPAGAGQSQTLAIISLVVGILGFTLCCGSFVPSIVAIVLGFMAKSKAASDPANYGGSGLALGGIITGVIGLILGVIFIVLYFLGALAGMMGNMG